MMRRPAHRLTLVRGTPQPATRARTTPHDPQMFYTRDTGGENYTCTVADGYGHIAMRLWAPASFFTEERQRSLRAMCETDFGVPPEPSQPATPRPRLKLLRPTPARPRRRR